jgi:hypothetical protein
MAGAQPFLLHSLVEFDELIEACLDLAGARSVLEIGSESGASTKRLVAGASGRGGELWCVEPAPTRELEELDRAEPAFHLVVGPSPGALRGIEVCDAYIIDGDHNYWTVSRELEHLGGQAADGAHPLVILHDVAWPAGRRDQYYSPAALPADALHPHSWDLGVVPGSETAVRGGFRGQGSFAFALHEGGARNGVRTAVEDYLEGRDELRFIVVPAIFGLGVVYSSEAPYAQALEAELGPLDGNPLIERLEGNRLELYLAVLRARQEVAELGLRQGRLLAEYDSSITTAETDAARLRIEVAQLRERLKHIDTGVSRPG